MWMIKITDEGSHNLRSNVVLSEQQFQELLQANSKFTLKEKKLLLNVIKVLRTENPDPDQGTWDEILLALTLLPSWKSIIDD